MAIQIKAILFQLQPSTESDYFYNELIIEVLNQLSYSILTNNTLTQHEQNAWVTIISFPKINEHHIVALQVSQFDTLLQPASLWPPSRKPLSVNPSKFIEYDKDNNKTIDEPEFIRFCKKELDNNKPRKVVIKFMQVRARGASRALTVTNLSPTP